MPLNMRALRVPLLPRKRRMRKTPVEDGKTAPEEEDPESKAKRLTE
jgi:hypothetical protein